VFGRRGDGVTDARHGAATGRAAAANRPARSRVWLPAVVPKRRASARLRHERNNSLLLLRLPLALTAQRVAAVIGALASVAASWRA
jgi:hypothetical protein